MIISANTILTLILALSLSDLVSSEPRGRNRGRYKELDNEPKQRKGRVFSLFNIVQFQNDPCTSQMTTSLPATDNTKNRRPDANRRGTCYTRRECDNRRGTVSGNCAAGFGVCCVFVANQGQVTENCTYLQNAGFPTSVPNPVGGQAPPGVMYTIQKCSDEVCSLRLDFDTFNTEGPPNEVGGGICPDTFTITSASQPGFPVICGQNSGQHVYIDIGPLAGDVVNLNFAFTGQSTNRVWDIKVSQIPCGINNAPDGCFQYFTGTTGTFQTFNFMNAAGNHIRNQRYSACIRREAGFCCIQYSVCPGVVGAFSLNTLPPALTGVTDAKCTTDFLQINGASSTCTSDAANLVSRICGTSFTALTGKMLLDTPVCDCSEPFDITVVTDNTPIALPVVQSRGACLCYTQLPCASTL